MSFDLQERLPAVCGSCACEFQINPSLSMRMGINSGHAKCPQCQSFLHVELVNGRPVTEVFDAWLKRTRESAACEEHSREDLGSAVT